MRIPDPFEKSLRGGASATSMAAETMKRQGSRRYRSAAVNRANEDPSSRRRCGTAPALYPLASSSSTGAVAATEASSTSTGMIHMSAASSTALVSESGSVSSTAPSPMKSPLDEVSFSAEELLYFERERKLLDCSDAEFDGAAVAFVGGESAGSRKSKEKQSARRTRSVAFAPAPEERIVISPAPNVLSVTERLYSATTLARAAKIRGDAQGGSRSQENVGSVNASSSPGAAASPPSSSSVAAATTATPSTDYRSARAEERAEGSPVSLTRKSLPPKSPTRKSPTRITSSCLAHHDAEEGQYCCHVRRSGGGKHCDGVFTCGHSHGKHGHKEELPPRAPSSSSSASPEEQKTSRKKKKKGPRMNIVGERPPSPAPPPPPSSHKASSGAKDSPGTSSPPVLPAMTKSEQLRESRRRSLKKKPSSDLEGPLPEVSDEDCEFWLVLVDEEGKHDGDGHVSSSGDDERRHHLAGRRDETAQRRSSAETYFQMASHKLDSERRAERSDSNRVCVQRRECGRGDHGELDLDCVLPEDDAYDSPHFEAKSDGQLATEKAWLEADRVWVVHKRGFCGASLLRKAPDENGVSSGSIDKVRIKLDHNEEILEVEEEDIEKANPPHLDHIEDLSQLRFVNESSVLHVIRQRYGSNLVHTYAGGNSLLVVNPMTPLSVYSEKVAQLFKGCRAEDMPPHIYAVAQRAHSTMLATRRDQSIVLLGRSGSGKTTNAQHVLNYLLLTAGHHSKSITVDKLHAIFKLLDAFGNSRTVMNTNASRYSNVFSLDFDPSGNVVSASVQVLMLEKSRIVRRPEGEPNFHVFYQLLAGVDAATRKQLHLEGAVAVDGSSLPCLFMTPLQRAEDKQRAFVAWGHIMAAMHCLNIQPKEVRVLCSVLAAIYHLGVAGATQGPGGKFQFVRPQFAAWAASLLGTTQDELLRVMRGGAPNAGSGSSPSGNSPPLAPVEALEGFVTGLYSEVFSALIALINRSISASNSQGATSIVVVDTPGVQNPASCGRVTGASFEDLCHNYLQERLQLLFHDMTFTLPQDRYAQEQVEFPVVEDMSSDVGGAGSPGPMVNLLDFANQLHHSLAKGSSQSDAKGDRRGLLWLLDDEAILPGSSDRSLLERIASVYGERQWRPLLASGLENNSVTLMHLQGTCPVTYNISGWLKACRENPMVRAAACCLTETSTRDDVRELFAACRPTGGGSGATGIVSGSIAGIEGGVGLRRASSIRRAFTTGTASIRRKSLALQTKFQADGLIEQLRRTRVHFVHCFLPQVSAGLCDLKQPQSPDARDEILMNVPLVRNQLRGAQILEAVRIHKQGFPESVPFQEFVRKFSVFLPPESKSESGSPDKPVVYDEKKLILEYLVPQLDLEPNVFRVGLSQIFFRAGVLSQLESLRDERIQGRIVMLQAYCRGCLARRRLAKRRVEDVAIRCIQKNVSKYLAVRSWPWWRLYTKVAPLLNVHRTEEELRSRTEEVEALRAKLEKAEKERSQLKSANDRLEARLSELTADLAEEHSTSTLAAEKLEAETAERMRLQQEFGRLQGEFKSLEKSRDKLETELMYSRATSAAAQMNGDAGDEDGVEDASVYKVRYERAMREMDHVKQRLMSKHEEDVEQLINVKKNLEKRLHDAQEETEEQRQVVSQWKRKVTRLQGELADLKHLHEEQTGRNNILEKRQRKFDAELQSAQDEVKAERREKERVQRERDLALADKYALEQSLQTLKMDFEVKDERVQSLMKELDDVSSSSTGDNEITALKRVKHDLELRIKEQDEELDDLSGQAQLWEAAKTRLEMSLEQMRKEHRKEIAQLTEEMEEIRANAQKKVRALEAQLETEHEERTQLMRDKHELERKLTELHTTGIATKAEQSKIQALKRELKKTRALLQDAQTALDRAQDNNPSRVIIRQLKNQLEDLEFAKMAAVKARQVAEAESRDLQSQMEEMSRSKSDVEQRIVNLQREKNSLLSQLEDHEDELKEVMRKFKAAVQQSSVDQSVMVDQANQIAQLEQERANLRDHLSDLTAKLDAMAGEEVHALEAKKLAAKIRQLEGRFELEQSTKTRLEAMITKLKEQVEALTQDLENSRVREQTAQEAQKRAVRQLRDAQDEYATLQLRETEALSKKEALEQHLDQYETENLTLKSDLTLALKRIEDLQAAMQEGHDDSDSDLGSNRLGSSAEDDDDESESDVSGGTFLSVSRNRDDDDRLKRSRHSSQSTSATNDDEADRSLRIEEERFALSPSHASNKSGGISLLNSPTGAGGGGSHESEV